MSNITTDMVNVFNSRLGATGSPWRIVPRDYDNATYSSQTIAGAGDPSVAPFLADHLTYDNGSSLQQMVTLKVERALKLTHTFSVQNMLKVGTKGTLKFNVGVVAVEAELSLEYTRDETTTDTTEETVTISFEQPVLVPPNTRISMQTLVQLQTVTNLPFELRVVLLDGRFAVTPKEIAPLFRYYDSNEDHFYSRTPNVPDGFISEGIACNVSNTPGPGLARLLRYYDGTSHFYTTNPGEVNPGDMAAEGDEGYVFTGAAPGAIPLYRYYDGVAHFYTTNFGELGNGSGDMKLEGIAAYVTPANVNDPALFRSVSDLFPNPADRLFSVHGHYKGQSTDRDIQVILKQEPIPATLRGTDPVLRHASEDELKSIPIFSSNDGIVAKPGQLVDLNLMLIES